MRHHAGRAPSSQSAHRSAAPPPRYPFSVPTPRLSEGLPITTACMVCAVRSRLAVARWLRSPAQDPQLWARGRAPAGGRPPAGRQLGVRSRLGIHRPPARCGQPRRLPGGNDAAAVSHHRHTPGEAELSGKPTVSQAGRRRSWPSAMAAPRAQPLHGHPGLIRAGAAGCGRRRSQRGRRAGRRNARATVCDVARRAVRDRLPGRRPRRSAVSHRQR